MTHQEITDMVLFLLLGEDVARDILEGGDEPHLLILGRDILTVRDKNVYDIINYVTWWRAQQMLN